jgi:hypothetical protein
MSLHIPGQKNLSLFLLHLAPTVGPG